MVMLSLSGIVLLTNRVVPAIEEDEQFVPALHNRPDNTGLRRKMVLGRMWDSSASKKQLQQPSHNISGSENNNSGKKKEASGGKQNTQKKKRTDKYPDSSSDVTSNSQSKTEKNSKEATTVLPHRLQMHMPPSMPKMEHKFDKVDPKLYPSSISTNGSKAGYSPSSTTPRIVMLYPSITLEARKIKTYTADFTDNTQFYGVLPSDDERLEKMEMRSPYSENECVPMQEWQTAYQPSCNGMHELALHTLGASTDDNDEDNSSKKLRRGDVEGLSATLFGTGGFWRYAWKVVLGHNDHRRAEKDTVVLKTLK